MGQSIQAPQRLIAKAGDLVVAEIQVHQAGQAGL